MKEYFTLEEIKQLMLEYNISEDSNYYRFWSVINDIEGAIIKEAEQEKEKLSGKGYYHDSNNRKPFVEAAKKKLGSQFDHCLEIDEDDDNYCYHIHYTSVHSKNYFYICVEEDKVEICYPIRIKLGLHSEHYDELLDYIYNPDGPIQKAYMMIKKLGNTEKHYENKQKELYNGERLNMALKFPEKYEEIKAEFIAKREEISLLAEFDNLMTWEEALIYVAGEEYRSSKLWEKVIYTAEEIPLLKHKDEYKRKQAISKIVTLIDRIAKKTLRKTVKNPESLKLPYELLQASLIVAKECGWTTEDDNTRIKPWDSCREHVELANRPEAMTNAYHEDIEKEYNEAIAKCKASGSAYSQKKLKKILSDQEFCKALKAAYGIDCFIDRSFHSPSVYHLNLELNNQQVVVFRIGKQTGALKTYEEYIKYALTLKKLSSKFDSLIRFKELPYNSVLASKLRNSKDEFEQQIGQCIKGYFTGYVSISGGNVGIQVPNGKTYWQITIKKNEVMDVLPTILDDLKAITRYSRNFSNYTIKGIYVARLPHL